MTTSKKRRPKSPGTSRSAVSRRRSRAGFVQVWIPRAVIEDAAVESGVVEEWDIDSEQKLRRALRDYLIELK